MRFAPQVELMICHEPGGDMFEVSLWIVSSTERETEIRRTKPMNWLALSSVLEEAQFMTESELGKIDAQIARGESVRRPLEDSSFQLPGIFFERTEYLPERSKISGLRVAGWHWRARMSANQG